MSTPTATASQYLRDQVGTGWLESKKTGLVGEVAQKVLKDEGISDVERHVLLNSYCVDTTPSKTEAKRKRDAWKPEVAHRYFCLVHGFDS